MTVPTKPTNPLMLRKDLARYGATLGSDAARQELQDHCDRLNAMNGGRDNWHVIGEAPNRTITKGRG